jgi:hypothetical protein
LLKKLLYNKISIQGVLVSIVILLGLFGPWLTYGFDSYSTINPESKTGQINYHSRVELTPLFGSMYKDDILVGRYWLISPGLTLAGLLLAISACLSIFKYNSSWVYFILFMVASLGIIVFFLSVGRGISIGVFTKVGWGLGLTGFGLLVYFVVSFREMSRNYVSRYMD